MKDVVIDASPLIFSVTVSSGYRERIFQFLTDLNTSEANEAIESIMKEHAIE